jgi:parvulin-like peptidyl-prolyl isomerase
MRLAQTILLGCCAAAAPLTTIGCGGSEVPPNAVAQVGDVLISKNDFRTRFAAVLKGQHQGSKPIVYEPPDFDRCVAAKDKQDVAPEGQKDKSDDVLRKECKDVYEQLRTRAMELVIQQEWVREEARKRGVTVTAAAARKEFKRQKAASFKTEKAFKDFLLTSGQTVPGILSELRVNLSVQKLSKRATAGKLKVSEADIKHYYAQNKKQLGKPETRSVRIVIAKTQAQSAKAKQALDAGQSWDVVAKQYSIDKSSAKGGLLPAVTTTGDKTIDTALKNAPVGTLSKPQKTQFGWWIFEVEKITPATVPSLKKARKQVIAAVKLGKRQALIDQFAATFREEYRDKTVCADDFKVASCNNGPLTNPTVPQQSMQQPQSQQSN